MNYLRHYNILINRARNRILDFYTETHHIIPKCVGGLDERENLVELTPEEHYTAHQLLIKIYPNNYELVHAAIMMCVKSKNHNRSKNKLYGWLKRKHSELTSIRQMGEGNSQFGTCWIYNKDLQIVKKIEIINLEKYINNSWQLGRTERKSCPVCGKLFYQRKNNNTCSRKCYTKTHPDYNILLGREKEFIEKHKEEKNIAKIRKSMNYIGSTDYFYRWTNSILKDYSSMNRIDESESSDASLILANPTK